MIYVGRAAWGGPVVPFGRKMTAPAASVTVHHSLAPAVACGASVEVERAAMQQIQRHHEVANGWQGIGYNFAITQNGHIYEGRGWGRVGAHAGTNAGNATSIGVCFLIDGRTEAPSEAALAALQALRESGVQLGHLARNHGVKLHRDWKQTECPGDMVAAAIRKLRPTTPTSRPVLRRGSTGSAVMELQRLLNVAGPGDVGYGSFGPQTEARVREFQAARSLTVDGVVGPESWREMGG